MKHRHMRTDIRRSPLPRLAGTRAFACGALVTAAFTLTAEPARADFRLCNNTGNRVGIAVGYKENEGWTTGGLVEHLRPQLRDRAAGIPRGPVLLHLRRRL